MIFVGKKSFLLKIPFHQPITVYRKRPRRRSQSKIGTSRKVWNTDTVPESVSKLCTPPRDVHVATSMTRSLVSCSRSCMSTKICATRAAYANSTSLSAGAFGAKYSTSSRKITAGCLWTASYSIVIAQIRLEFPLKKRSVPSIEAQKRWFFPFIFYCLQFQNFIFSICFQRNL